MATAPASGPYYDPRRAGGSAPAERRGGDGDRNGWAASATVFAGVLLLVDGVISVLEGVSGIAKDHVFVTSGNGYAYRFSLTTWGWIHLGFGVVLFLVGLGVLAGSRLARWIGIALAGASLLTQFMFLPYYPLWSIVVMALDVFVIWGLATYDSRRRTA